MPQNPLYVATSRRSQEGKAFPWEKLPQDLNFRVIDLATCNRWLRGGGQSSLANFSRVSKSWEALIKAYPASIVCKAKQLQAACRIFSGMTSVKILIEEETTLDLSHLKSCSKLLCVGLDNRGKYPEDGIWLNDLPESVTKLELLRLDIDSSFLESASHLKTTELSIICPTMESYMSYLPEYMPFLKVSIPAEHEHQQGTISCKAPASRMSYYSQMMRLYRDEIAGKLLGHSAKFANPRPHNAMGSANSLSAYCSAPSSLSEPAWTAEE